MEQLVRAETDDFDNLRVETSEGTFRKVNDQMIKRGALPLDAGRDLGRERAVSFVAERLSSVHDGAGQIGTARGNRRQDLEGGQTGRSNHGRDDHSAPTGTGWPARNSRAVIGRLPSA